MGVVNSLPKTTLIFPMGTDTIKGSILPQTIVVIIAHVVDTHLFFYTTLIYILLIIQVRMLVKRMAAYLTMPLWTPNYRFARTGPADER